MFSMQMTGELMDTGGFKMAVNTFLRINHSFEKYILLP
jgi:hypothetical protein